MKAPRESYIRVGRMIGHTEVVLGIALMPEDSLEAMYVAGNAIVHTPSPSHFSDDRHLAEQFDKLIREKWPERAYFIEVGPSDHRYVQIFQPWPRD